MHKSKIKIQSPKQCIAVVFILSLTVFFLINFPVMLTDAIKLEKQQKQSGSNVIKTFEDTYNKDFFAKDSFISLNGLAQRLLNHRVMNNVVKLNNGYLTETVKQRDMSDRANKVIALNNWLATKKIPLLYVEEPYKISKYDSQLPTGVEDYSNTTTDQLLGKLKQKNVSYLDLRAEIRDDKLDHYSLFFRTDHHWLPTTGFWAYTKVANYMEKNYGWQMNDEYLDLNNYIIYTYKEWYLGSLGKRVSPYFGGVDDIDLIYPKFKTNMSLSIPSVAVKRQGDFYNALFEMDWINKRNYWDLIPYSVYAWGDRDLTYMKNFDAPLKKKVLVVKDSFALTVTPFLLTQVSDIVMVDFRYYSATTLQELIEKEKIDSIIILFNPSIFENDMSWNW